MLLEDKNAVIYRGGGSIGGAVARAFAREGATVHLAGRTLKSIEKVAEAIRSAGGLAETAQVDSESTGGRLNSATTEMIQVGALSMRFLVEAADSNGSASVFECFVPAGCNMPAPHSHDAFEETIYGLEGVTTWIVGQNSRRTELATAFRAEQQRATTTHRVRVPPTPPSCSKWKNPSNHKELPAHYAVPKPEGDGAVQAWVDLLPAPDGNEMRWPKC